jgi:hypothetical protein
MKLQGFCFLCSLHTIELGYNIMKGTVMGRYKRMFFELKSVMS